MMRAVVTVLALLGVVALALLAAVAAGVALGFALRAVIEILARLM
jgi:hypothetical protein